PISVRYNPKAPRLMANWLSPGDLMTVSMKDLAIYDPVTKDRILSLNKGAKLYLGNPGAEAGYERVTTEGGIKGVATSLSLIYGTKSKKRPFFDLGFSANDSLVHSGQLFGVPEWLVMLLWLASVPALHFLSVRLLGSPRKRLAITNLGPALLVALGYMAANVISLLKRQSSSIKPEIEWFYSSLHLTPARFSSYVHWALYLAWIFAIIAFAVLVSEHVKLGGKKALLSIPCALAANLLAYAFFEILALLFSYIISAIIFFAFLSLLSRFFGRRRVYVHHHFLHKH
ncbi:MAG: hypothetical protein LBC41_10910, partial [Clostridiales bacterium]|nr:hypothetical protein [Clostridiales bacterium]